MTRYIIIHRKGHHRRGYTRSDGTYVKPCYVSPTTFKAKDRGAAGKGIKKVPIKRNNALTRYGYALNKPASQRHKSLNKAVKRYGAKRTWRRLLALRQVRERPAGREGPSPPPRNTRIGREWRALNSDMNYIKEKFHPDLKPRAAIKARRGE